MAAGSARITVSIPLFGPSSPKVSSIRRPATPKRAFSLS